MCIIRKHRVRRMMLSVSVQTRSMGLSSQDVGLSHMNPHLVASLLRAFPGFFHLLPELATLHPTKPSQPLSIQEKQNLSYDRPHPQRPEICIPLLPALHADLHIDIRYVKHFPNTDKLFPYNSLLPILLHSRANHRSVTQGMPVARRSDFARTDA